MVFIEKADIQITCSSAGNQRNKGIIFEFFQRTLPAGDCFVSTASDEDIMIAAQCGSHFFMDTPRCFILNHSQNILTHKSTYFNLNKCTFSGICFVEKIFAMWYAEKR